MTIALKKGAPTTKRIGAARLSDVSPELLAQLHAGTIETATLSESLAMDFAVLVKNTFPELPASVVEHLCEARDKGYMERYRLGAKEIYAHLGQKGIATCRTHSSDVVRGFGSIMVGLHKSPSLAAYFEAIKPFAADSHFGVREMAWIGIRHHVVDAVKEAVVLLTPWAADPDENIRRFASELLRPRGVWCVHIPLLKENPELALPVLEPLKADTALYVRNSVANWLNDASKTQPEWVTALCARWYRESSLAETEYICKRAMRSLNKK